MNRVIELDQGKVVLDDRVADSVDLTSRLDCDIRLTRPEAAFAKSIQAWGFVDAGDGLLWSGSVAGADRLRFLGTLSRYAALIAALDLREAGEADVSARESLHG